MPQNRETGRQGHENGSRNADALGTRLKAKRISNQSNEFDIGGRRVLLKTGDRGAVISGPTLQRVEAVIYGFKTMAAGERSSSRPVRFESTGRRLNPGAMSVETSCSSVGLGAWSSASRS
jgi:hypothetical protein